MNHCNAFNTSNHQLISLITSIQRMPYLDVEVCGRIVGMQQEGLSYQAIAEVSGIPLTTVYDMMIKFQCIGTVKPQLKTGQPTILKEQDFQNLNCIITRCCCLTVSQVANLMASQVSNLTIQCEIHKLGNFSWIAPKKPYLQPEDFQAHLTFSQAHINWMIEDWAQVIWTNGLSFKLGKFFWGGLHLMRSTF
ncbi:hypothetical protein O181_001530 [Austropuccinia psidii MF-1]|uniref:Homeodomain-like DNA binding domain-containing transcription factor n=1 Tax=Austropuccinia psidii MF-1 TaxID=1389203 RepID=A0A9Q3GBX3_9BASI|nr:hypothetical protein [Austropuccinia psidii MF-1]